MAFQRFLAERFTSGSNLIVSPDLLPSTFWRLLKNARLTRRIGVLSSRAGMSAQSAALGGLVRMLWTRFGVSSDSRYAHVGTTLYRLSSGWGSAVSLGTCGTTPVTAANMVDGGGSVQSYFTNTTLGQIKDDGTTQTTWGIPPPTAAPSAVVLAADLLTVIDAMDNAALWTVTAGLSAGPADDTNIKQLGTGSVTITVAAGTLGTIARSLSGTTDLDVLAGGDATVKADDYIHLWVRADRPDRVSYLQIDFDLDTTTVANAFRTNYYSIRLPGLTWLNQGRDQWTKVQVPKSQFQRFGPSTSLDWSTVECVRLSVLTTSDGACQLYFDDFKLRGGTDIVGSVRYAVCYRNDATKGRGNPYLDSDDQVVYTTAIDVDRQRTSITTTNVIQGGANHPGDTQITHMRLYRSIDKGDALQIAEIADTTASPYVDAVSVASTLLTRTLEADNHVPPSARVVFGPGGQNRLFLLFGQNDLAYSKAFEDDENRAENHPPTFRTKIGDGSERALAGMVTDTTVLVWTDEQTYSLQGLGNDTYVALPIPNSRGIVGSFAATEGDGTVFFVSQDGIYAQQGLRQERLTDAIAEFFKGITVAGQAGWNTTASVLASVQLQWHSDPLSPFVLMLYPEAGSATINRELYLGRNPATGRYEHISFDTRGNTTLQCLHQDIEANLLYGGGTDGLVYQLEDDAIDTDAGTSFDWQADTPASTHGRPDLQAYISQAFVELEGQSVTVSALYDKHTTVVVLGTGVGVLSLATRTALPTGAPETLRADMALRLTAVITTRLDVFRYGWNYELQPEEILFWDSGLVEFGYQTVLTGVWYTLAASSAVVVTLRMDQQAEIAYTLVSTGGLRQADRFFVTAGIRGRALRLTMESDTPFRLYACSVKGKPYGTALGARDIPMLRSA